MKCLKSIGWLAVLLLAGTALGAERPPSGPERLQIGGVDYLRLTQWARANAFEVAWLKRDETLLLRKGHTRIKLTVDSQEARFDETLFWMLHPVANHNGFFYLSAQDLDTTLRPLLSPPRSRRPAAPLRTICLDPGHGGKDPGFSVTGHEEKKYTLLLAEELKQQLGKAGFKVILTRAKDEAIELPDRAARARAQKADLFISLHFNATDAGAATVQGPEVYCLTPPGAASTNSKGEGATTEKFPGNAQNDRNVFLAYEVQKSLRSLPGAEDRGVKRARFAVLREAQMPAILIEAGFMSHPAEGKRIFDASYRRRLARAVVEGVQAYKLVVERKN